MKKYLFSLLVCTSGLAAQAQVTQLPDGFTSRKTVWIVRAGASLNGVSGGYDSHTKAQTQTLNAFNAQLSPINIGYKFLLNKNGSKDFTTLKYWKAQIFRRDYLFLQGGGVIMEAHFVPILAVYGLMAIVTTSLRWFIS